MTTTTTEVQVEATEPTTETIESVSPYACAKVVNDQLAKDGFTKTLPPQMFYNYCKKGMIPTTEGKVTLIDLMAWYTKYTTKLQAKAEKIASELQGE